MIRSFASSATASLVDKNLTKRLSPKDRLLCLRLLKDNIDLLNMIGSFASGATASLVAKIGMKELFHYYR